MSLRDFQTKKYFGQLFDQTDVLNILHHRYKCTCDSILENLYLMRVYNGFASIIPRWIVPNLVTLTGGFTYILGFIILFLNTNFCEECHDNGHYNLIYILCFLIYQLCDGSDGPHARNTGQASPLGECFDHGVDGIIAPCTMAAVASQIGFPLSTKMGLIGQIISCFGGYCIQLHARHTGMCLIHLLLLFVN